MLRREAPTARDRASADGTDDFRSNGARRRSSTRRRRKLERWGTPGRTVESVEEGLCCPTYARTTHTLLTGLGAQIAVFESLHQLFARIDGTPRAAGPSGTTPRAACLPRVPIMHELMCQLATCSRVHTRVVRSPVTAVYVYRLLRAALRITAGLRVAGRQDTGQGRRVVELCFSARKFVRRRAQRP